MLKLSNEIRVPVLAVRLLHSFRDGDILTLAPRSTNLASIGRVPCINDTSILSWTSLLTGLLQESVYLCQPRVNIRYFVALL